MWLLENLKLYVWLALYFSRTAPPCTLLHILLFFHVVEIIPDQYIWSCLILSNGLTVYNCVKIL